MAGAPGRSGGARQGQQGKAYSNRKDMNAHQPVKVAHSQTYGEGAKLQRAQQAMPLPNAQAPVGVPAAVAAPPAPQQGPMGAPQPGVDIAAPPPVPPGAQDPLRPTENPNEPVTAGLPFGPGPGPQQPYADGLNGAPSDNAAWLKALYSQAANTRSANDLLDLIQSLSNQQ